MKPLIVGNWKCNPKTAKEAGELFGLIKKGLKNTKKAEVVICPPFFYASSLAATKEIISGSQDCFWEQEGAFTGEISPLMLKNLNCKYVIIGHSERRRHFNETNEMINKKLKAVLEIGLNPILCIGETQEERNKGQTEVILKKQITLGLKNIPASKISSNFVIAYEPVWAVGTGDPCDIDEARKMNLIISKIISDLYNSTVSKKIRILYGGSVNSKNAADYVKKAGLAGLLVGGASLNAQEFIEIVKRSV